MPIHKSAVVIFDKLVPRSKLEEDLKNMEESNFFGLLPSTYYDYSFSEDKRVPVVRAFINLNNDKYMLDIDTYLNDKKVQLVEFTTDNFNFGDDLLDNELNGIKKSSNIQKLISLLKNNLPYYLMTLYLVDYDPKCPGGREILEMYVLGKIEIKKDHNCFQILDSPGFPLINA